MDRALALIAAAGLSVLSGCGASEPESGGSGSAQSASDRGTPEPSVVGEGCHTDDLPVDALSLGVGPISVRYDLASGEISVSASAGFAWGPVSLAVVEDIAKQAGCFTVELIDRAADRRYLLAIDHGGDEVLISGLGTISQVVTRSRLLVDVTELCELHVYSADHERPVMARSCSGLDEQFWVAQFGAFREEGNAPTRVAELEALGVDDLGIFSSSTWASACPGHMVVWSERFETEAAAVDYVSSLPPELPEAPWVRRISNSLDDRDPCTDS